MATGNERKVTIELNTREMDRVVSRLISPAAAVVQLLHGVGVASKASTGPTRWGAPYCTLTLIIEILGYMGLNGGGMMKLWHLLGCLLLLQGAVAAAPEPLVLSRVSISAKADLGEAVFNYEITPTNRSANVGIQIFAKREDLPEPSQFDLIVPTKPDGTPVILNLFRDQDNRGTFTARLKKGRYGAYRLLFFRSPDGQTVDYQQLLYDSAKDPKAPKAPLALTILTEQKRVTAPVLVLPKAVSTAENPDGTHRVTFEAAVKLPPTYRIDGNGLWAMVKGSGGFSQVWVDLTKAEPGNDPFDSYRKVPVQVTLDRVKVGLWNVEAGLFKPTFGDALQWIYPGLDFEVGGDAWVARAPSKSVPPRLRVRNRKWETLDGKPFDFYESTPAARQAVSFVRGGNYGNAVTWTIRPALNTPGYFALLREMGCRWIRVNFNPDRFPDEPVYQHAVDQVVENIWSAGLYPVLCPQSLPTGGSREEQVTKAERVVQTLAGRFRGKSVWLEICNEPHEFATWADWKPVAVRLVKAIRSIDPEAFVIVPFEGYGKDGRAAAKDPIHDVAVDLYDGHAYVEPGQLGMLYGPAIQAGLPLMLGEYGGGPDYLKQMHGALEKLPTGLLAAGPWAFTITGQDSLPLILDGSTAELRFTPAGQVIALDYAAWETGKLRPR